MESLIKVSHLTWRFFFSNTSVSIKTHMVRLVENILDCLKTLFLDDCKTKTVNWIKEDSYHHQQWQSNLHSFKQPCIWMVTKQFSFKQSSCILRFIDNNHSKQLKLMAYFTTKKKEKENHSNKIRCFYFVSEFNRSQSLSISKGGPN